MDQPYPYTQVQLDWIKALRDHPERQISNSLGWKNPTTGKIRLCCLGQGLLCLKPDIHFDEILIDLKENQTPTKKELTKEYESELLTNSYKELNLRESNGEFEKEYKHSNLYSFSSLTDMNDQGFSWVDIAYYLESNPENVFTNHIPDFYK